MPGATSCTSCPVNTSSYAEASVCCPGGYFSPLGAENCTSCSPGKYSSSGALNCLPCDAYTYSNEYASSSCKTCPDGTTSNSGSISCSSCPANTFIQPECLPGYQYYEAVGTCYHIDSSFLNWNDAKVACATISSGKLVTVKDLNENIFLNFQIIHY